MNNDTLEIAYHVRGFRQTVYVPVPEWPGCVFEQNDNLDVTLRIKESGLTPDTDLDSLIALVDARVRQLVLAWEFQYGRRLQLTRRNIAWPSFPQEDGTVNISDTVAVSDRAHAEIVFAPAPQQMPQVPLGAERWIRTFAEAGDFEDYVEEQLRRHYLVIEELRDKQGSELDPGDQQRCEEISLIRDFVSHAECDRNRKLVDLISAQVPSAVVAGRSKPTVRFDRLSTEHRNFVARYEVDSRRIARKLIELAIEESSTTP